MVQTAHSMMINAIFPKTLSRYLAKTYTIHFLQILGILLGIVYMFEVVELLRRAAKVDGVPFTLLLQMGLLKLPEVGQIILPFGILFGALYCFWTLVRRQELVILRSAGLSVWQFLGPIVGVAVLVGIIHMTIINPIGATLISRYQVLENLYLKANDNTVSIGDQGLWLRQKTEDGGVILYAQKVKMPQWQLSDVSIFYFDPNNALQKRLDASSAFLRNGYWEFEDVIINVTGQQPLQKQRETLKTDLTIFDIEDSFSSPEETPFWSLPSYIRTMEATGFNAKKLHIHFQTLLSQPLLFAAMVILAATVSLKSSRSQATGFLIVAGAAIGFIVFFASSFLKALGASDQIPVAVAAWFPSLIALILGISVILTTEDG